MSTKDVLDRHMAAFLAGDLDMLVRQARARGRGPEDREQDREHERPLVRLGSCPRNAVRG